MKCFKCGNEIQDGSMMCGYCGVQFYNNQMPVQNYTYVTNQMSVQNQQYASNQQTYQQQIVSNSKVADKLNKSKKNKIVYVVVVVLAIFLVLSVNKDSSDKSKGAFESKNHNKSSVDMEDYIEIRYEGYEGYGNYRYEFDDDKFCDDYKDIIEFEDSSNSSVAVYTFVDEVMIFNSNSFNNLSNGDEVFVEVTFDQDKIKDYNVDWESAIVTGKVEGLKEPKVENPFENYEIYFVKHYDGTADLRTRSIYDGDDFCSYDFRYDGAVEIGNEVTVSIRSYDLIKHNTSGTVFEPSSLKIKIEDYFCAPYELETITDDVFNSILEAGHECLMEEIEEYNYTDLAGINHDNDFFYAHVLCSDLTDENEYIVYIKNDGVAFSNVESVHPALYYKYVFENLIVNQYTGEIYYEDLDVHFEGNESLILESIRNDSSYSSRCEYLDYKK